MDTGRYSTLDRGRYPAHSEYEGDEKYEDLEWLSKDPQGWNLADIEKAKKALQHEEM